MSTLKLGIPLTCPLEDMPALARAAEDAGVESLWLSEHLVWPETTASPYPYSADGQPPVGKDIPWHDPWVLLAWIAAQTTRIKLGTSVYILPLREPHVTARAVGTLDVVSGGRAILGVGVGWMAEEFEAAGQSFAGRGRRTDEIIEVLRRLWSEDPVGHEGEHYRFAPVHFQPKPPQGAGLPIVVGGESAPALRRAARLGDGWIGMIGHTPESAAERVAELTAMRAEYGRADQAFEVTLGMPSDLTPADAQALLRAGVGRVVLWSADASPWTALRDVERLTAALR